MKLLKVLFLLLWPIQVFSQNTFVYSDDQAPKLVQGSFISVLEDETNKLTSNQVLNSDQFKTISQIVPNFGVSKSSFWIKFVVTNSSSNTDLLLNLSYPNLDAIELHLFYPDSDKVEKMSKDMPFGSRNYYYPGYVFDVNIKKNANVTILIKITSGGQIMAPIFIGNKKAVFNSIRSENLFVGIYSGIILIMFFYNLFIYFTVRDKVYLYYVLYILVVGLVQLCLLGYTSQFFWPDSSWLMHHSVYLLSPLSGLIIIEFIKVFLQTSKFTPKLHKGFYALTAIYLIYIILDFLDFGDELYNIIQLCAMILSLYILIISYKIMKMKYRPAKFLFYSWSIFLVGVFVYALKDVGVLPYNNYTIYMMPIGSAIETALLSFALADRINILKKEKEESQSQTMKALQENERMAKEQNVVLEEKVNERTQELKESNKELSVTLKDLKEAQSHLVNAEKMASLGQLTAGVAHEINNPINFVTSSIKPLKRDINDLLNVLSKYEKVNEKNITEKVKEINDLKSSIDIDYVKEEINSLLKGIEDGASRTADIVKGLKTFSRIDETDLKRVDLNEGLDSTVILLHSMMNGKIKIIKEYNNIPKVECYAGKINQVFMNVLNNAIHAVLEKNSNTEEGVIHIKTSEDANNIIVRIKDNGTGIPDKIRNKIFDPFFTTKDVGEGTGLGLSIVYNIIESHKGKIEVETEMGIGTEFIITLPKVQVS